MTINAGNDEIYEITIDGTQVREVTVDGVIAWVEANFDVRNLSAPNEVTEGDNFTVTADVKNTGDGRDTQTISFNRGGSTDKTLKGGQTTTVSFGETISNSGDFTLKISSDDDSASQTVTVLTPANFDIRNLSAPNTVTEGNNFTVSADVVNTGQTSDTQNIDFNRGGSTNKSLSGNSSTNVSFNETINNTGTFNLSISSADDTESRNITVGSAIPEYGDHQWLMNEGSGTVLNDSIGSVTATINGSSWVSNESFTGGQALSFDGSNDYWVTDSSLSLGSTGTLFGWINCDDMTSFENYIFAFGDSGDPETGPEGGIVVFTDGDGLLGTASNSDGSSGSSSIRNAPFASTGSWGFFALTYSGDDRRLITFSNSQELGDNTGFANRSFSGNKFAYAGGNLGEYFEGIGDFFGIAEGVELTKSQITELWQATQR